MERLSHILREFNDRFGNIAWQDQDKIGKIITEELPAMVAEDRAYQNAKVNSDRQNARIEHDRALERAMTGLLADHTELFKQFSDNGSFGAGCWRVRSGLRMIGLRGRVADGDGNRAGVACIRILRYVHMGIAADRGASPADCFQTQPVHFFDFHNYQAADDEGGRCPRLDFFLPTDCGRLVIRFG